MNILIRRSASAVGAPASRQALAALLAADFSAFSSRPSPAADPWSGTGDGARGFGGRLAGEAMGIGCRRDFHFSAGPLEFRASGVSCAEYAVDDSPFWEEERSKGAPADEGLEIAKLGIAREIVASLAHKGIAKLFPIQVNFCSTICTLTRELVLSFFLSFFI